MAKKASAGKVREKLQKVTNKEAETLLAVVTTSSYRAASKKLGITEHGLQKRMNKFGIREQIAELPKQALERLQIGSIKAAGVLVDELDNNSYKSRKFDAATQILNRVGVALPRGNNTNLINVIAILGGASNELQSDNSDKKTT